MKKIMLLAPMVRRLALLAVRPLATLALVLLTAGCSTTQKKVSLRDIKEYDEAVSIAQAQGMDTGDMKKRLMEMILTYAKDPGEDPLLKAARKSSEAQEWAAAASMINATTPAPVYEPPPMSPGEFFRGMGR